MLGDIENVGDINDILFKEILCKTAREKFKPFPVNDSRKFRDVYGNPFYWVDVCRTNF